MIYDIQKQIALHFARPVEQLSFALLNGGIWRGRKQFRNVALFFDNGMPLAVARWYSRGEDTLIHENQVLNELYSLNAPAPKPERLFEIHGTYVLVEEYLSGTDLNTLVSRALLSPSAAISHARGIFEESYKKSSTPSNKLALREELTRIISIGEEHRLFGKESASVCQTVSENVTRYFEKLPTIQTSIVHFDFTLKNIIAESTKHTCRMIDFEFSKRSHFAFCDWFRLFLHSPVLLEEEMLDFEFPEKLRGIVAEPQTLQSFLILSAMVNLRIQLSVYPRYLWQETLEKERAQLLGSFAKDRVSINLMRKESALKIDSEAIDSLALDLLDSSAEQLTRSVVQLRRDYEATLSALSNSHARHRDALRHDREEHRKVIARLEKQLTAAEALLAHADQHIASFKRVALERESLLSQVSQSVAFRVGHLITSPLKKMPGAKQLRSLLRH